MRPGDSQGQLGLSSKKASQHTAYPKICSFNIVIHTVSCGAEHTALISSAGHLYAMGSNSFGQLGLGDDALASTDVPSLVESLLKQTIVEVHFLPSLV